GELRRERHRREACQHHGAGEQRHLDHPLPGNHGELRRRRQRLQHPGPGQDQPPAGGDEQHEAHHRRQQRRELRRRDHPGPGGQAEHQVGGVLAPLLPVELHGGPEGPERQKAHGHPVRPGHHLRQPHVQAGQEKRRPHHQRARDEQDLPAMAHQFFLVLLPPHYPNTSSKSSWMDLPRSSRSLSASPVSATRPSFKKRTSSKSASLSTTSWVDMTTVWLSARNSDTIARNTRERDVGSIPESGSSSSTTGALRLIARRILSRARIPLDSRLTRASGSSPMNLSRPSARSRSQSA